MQKLIEHVRFDTKTMHEQYERHASQCREIVKEVNKWGQKAKPNLDFLKPKRS